MSKDVSSGSQKVSSGDGPMASPAGTPEAGPSEGESNPPGGPHQHGVAAGLVIVATPIGNARDLSLRAIDVLKGAAVIACEDTRVTAKLLAIHGLKTPTLSYHEHNAARQRPRIIKHLENGETVALVSDAGTPLVSDPGYKLLTACLDAGLPVTAVPGPSSVMTALVLSGLPTDRFFFQGFLPNKAGPRRRVLGELVAVPGSLVVMESAKRLAVMLAAAAEVLGPRPAAVTREMTKRFEEVRRGDLVSLAAHYAEAGPPKGEICVVIGPAVASDGPDAETIDRILKAALGEGSIRDAARDVAAATGLPRRQLYQRALALSSELGEPDDEPT